GPAESDPGILAASGLVAGEGLAGVLVAGLVALGVVGKSKPPLLAGLLGEAGALILAAGICFLLYRASRDRSARAATD
ncbi:MAG TPA: peptide transporter, partial [Candidatus Polarisedimenticolia bacterium]|nr:peptide transporter [Candidatus Polarisedimenticolia bacterium]